MLSSFHCPKNKDVETFLVSKSIENENRSISRTYLIIRESDAALLGYFSLAIKELELCSRDVSKTLVKRLHGSNKGAERISVYLIGQLGKNFAIEDNHLNLSILLSETYGIIQAARKLIGGRVIILECEEILIELYKEHCFKLINTEPEDNGLVTMYIVITE